MDEPPLQIIEGASATTEQPVRFLEYGGVLVVDEGISKDDK